MSWHAAGTYRIEDGRGGAGDGAQRFAPLNSWPDNANLDKARRLLWPVKQKYGQKISWADLLVFAGNVALESMGFQTFGFGFGREDIWEPEEIFWGPEDTWLGDERYSGDRELAQPARRRADGPDLRQPRGPQRQPRPAGRGPRHPRDLPPDGDERRGDRRADRRRPLVRQDPRRRRPPTSSAPSPRPPRSSSRAWAGRAATAPARARDAITSGLEVTWTQTPTRWSNDFFENLFGFEWELTESPAGAKQWVAKDAEDDHPRPATTSSTKRKPTMLTTDLALRFDPAYEKISRRFLEHPDEFADWPSPRPGTSCCTATWARSRATSARGCPSRSCGRTRCRRSTTSWSPTTTSPRSRRRSSPPGCPCRSWCARRGRRRPASAAPTSAAGPTAPASGWSRSAAGRSTSRRARRRCSRTLERVQHDFNDAQSAASGSRSPT